MAPRSLEDGHRDYIYVVERSLLTECLESDLFMLSAETVKQKQNAWKRRNPPKLAIQILLYLKIQLTSLSLHPCLCRTLMGSLEEVAVVLKLASSSRDKSFGLRL